MDEQEFQCRAINDYYASVTDELDLKEGAVYTIMQTSPSGWWYAVNEDGEDGWVPSNYLERIDGGGDTSANDNNDTNDDNNNSNDIPNDDDIPAPIVDEEVDEEEKQDKKSSIVQQPQQIIPIQSNISKQEQPKVQSQPQPQPVPQPIPQPIQQPIQQPKKQEQQSFQQPVSQPFQQQSKSVSQPSQQQQQQQQKSVQSPSIPSSPQPASFNNVRDNAPEKPITEWSVDETLDYLQNGLQARNDFKLTQACRYLTQLSTKSDQCEEILSKSGLDIVFEVMRVTAGDVAIQMSCCAAIVVLCANPAAKQYPASTNGIYYISQAVKDNMNYRPFTILAYNAVCNFCHDHPRHRAMALETDIVDQVINGMEHFRGKPEGYKVHSASCLALRNIAADPKGQASVGPRGVEVITKGLEEYRSTKEVVEGSMGVLCNLCALPANGEAFVMGGGLQILDNLFSESTTEENTRLAAASVLHNLAANPDTALLLSADEGIDLLVKIIKKSQVDSLLFLNTLKVLAALLFKLPEDNKPAGNKKPEVMARILQRGIVAALNEAFGYDNKELQEVAATVLVVIAQTSRDLAQNLANADAPSRLIEPCMHDPSPQMLHCSLAIFFHVTDAFENQKRLMDAGILEFLTSDWYKKPTTREDTVRIGCGVFIKLFSNIRNQIIISQKEKEILEFINYNKQNKPSLTDLCAAIENALQQLDPTSSQTYAVSEKMISQPQSQPQPQQSKAVNKPQQQQQQPPPQEPIEEKQIEQPKQVKQLQKQMKLQENVTVQVESNAAPSSGKTHAEEEPRNDSTFKPDKFYTFDDLVKKKVNVPADSKEAYLNDDEFKRVFDMTKEQFYKQKPWKQKQLKNQKGLF